MTRSRKRKLQKLTALLAVMPAAQAQETTTAEASGPVLDEVVVTAQKRSENLQDVPLSVQAMGTARLEELHVTDFADYAQFLPTVSFQTAGPGTSHAYMRGVAAINNINHSGPSPSVGMYLDEQPITTIDGELDIHIYDIARVEALAGPQGTLFGASSQAGTIRIITNKPDPSGFKAGYDLEVNSVKNGSIGYVTEGFVNLPLTPAAAVRLVGWYEYAPGYIDNVPGTINWTNGVTTSNAPFVKKHYNDNSTEGARAALKLDLNDSWTVTPTVMGQVQNSHGFFGSNPAIGDLEVEHFLPEYYHDSWLQSALTVEGKISNIDVVYAGAYLERNVHSSSDYTDYAFFYDTAYGSSTVYKDNAGNPINPDQQIIGVDHYTKQSHELRIATPKDNRLRFIGGLFYERQTHGILQNYLVPGLSDTLSVPGWPGTWWLTDQKRVDVDKALFGELSFDLTSQLTANVGDRYFKSENSLVGFYGGSAGNPIITSEGVETCATPFVPFQGAPCSDLNGRTNASGNSPKVNLEFRFDKYRMVYATFSKGFRPGGINRTGGGTLPPYKPDYLTNYELGWKTSWFGNSLRFNGAAFREDWKDFQFSFLGPNALTIIQNAGQARILGIETDVEWAATDNLTLTAGGSLVDAELKQNYCGEAYCPTPEAPYGSPLPVTPKFKGELSARYTFNIADFRAFVEAAGVYVGARWADLRSAEYSDSTSAAGVVTATYTGNPRAILGREDAYELINLSTGLEHGAFHYSLYVNNVFDKRGELDRFAECDAVKCGLASSYIVPTQPRTIGIRFGQKL